MFKQLLKQFKVKMPKYIKCVCIRPNGEMSLETLEMRKFGHFLDLYSGNLYLNCSQIPQFVNGDYVFSLMYSSEKIGKENIYASILLDFSCMCGLESYENIHRGNFYLIKSDSELVKKNSHRVDYKNPISEEELIEYDCHIDCNENDIEFVENEIRKTCQYEKERKMGYLQWILYKLYIKR